MQAPSELDREDASLDQETYFCAVVVFFLFLTRDGRDPSTLIRWELDSKRRAHSAFLSTNPADG